MYLNLLPVLLQALVALPYAAEEMALAVSITKNATLVSRSFLVHLLLEPEAVTVATACPLESNIGAAMLMSAVMSS